MWAMPVSPSEPAGGPRVEEVFGYRPAASTHSGLAVAPVYSPFLGLGR